MRNISKMTLAEKFLFASTAIENALNTAEILNSLTLFGYDVRRLEEGKSILYAAEVANQQKDKEYSLKYQQTDEKQKIRVEAEKKYRMFVKVARIAFKDSNVKQKQLRITGKRESTLEGFIQDATLFYNISISNQEILNGLGTFGITSEALQAGLEEVIKLQTLHSSQTQAKGKAESSTEIRDVKIKALDTWLADFIKISRIALAGTPQLLEALGIS
jgi:hypothetical protein